MGRLQEASRNQGVQLQGRNEDLKDVECFQRHKQGHYTNKCTESKAEDTKGAFEKQKIGYLWSVEGELPRISRESG